MQSDEKELRVIYFVPWLEQKGVEPEMLIEAMEIGERIGEIWKAPVMLISTVEAIVKHQIPTFFVHDIPMMELNIHTPFYVLEYSNGLKSVIALEESEQLSYDPMYG